MDINKIHEFVEQLKNFSQENAQKIADDVIKNADQAGVSRETRKILLTHVKKPENALACAPLFNIDHMHGSQAGVFNLMLDASGSMEGWEPVVKQMVSDISIAYLKSAFYKKNPNGLLFGVSSFNEEVQTLIPYMYYHAIQNYQECFYQPRDLTNIPKAICHQVTELLVQRDHLESYNKVVNLHGLFVTDGHNTQNSDEIPQTRAYLEEHVHYNDNIHIAFIATHSGGVKIGEALGFVKEKSLIYAPQGKLNTEEFKQELRRIVKLVSCEKIDDISKQLLPGKNSDEGFDISDIFSI